LWNWIAIGLRYFAVGKGVLNQNGVEGELEIEVNAEKSSVVSRVAFPNTQLVGDHQNRFGRKCRG
jgi:hypothetical protein